MHRPRRGRNSRKSLDVEGGDSLYSSGGTSFSNPSFGNRNVERRKRLALVGAATLIVLVGVLGVHAITSATSKREDEGIPEVQHQAFTIDSKTSVNTANAEVFMMKHSSTGMPVMAVVPRDLTQDATFGISFRTPVEDNKGIAQIVQNAVQAGSKTYPVKDPINQLLAGSLQTHLHTCTEKDRSNFVVASRNLQDFTNSMKVMLDGIFHPLLGEPDHEWIFRQEGWRIFQEPPEDYLAASGNAYNSARASMMFPNNAIKNHKYKSLFKDHIYQWQPEGRWNEILSSVRSDMINFHDKYYVPQNARVFCYGHPAYVNACLDNVHNVVDGVDTTKSDATFPDDSIIPFKALDDIETSNTEVAYPSYQETKDWRLTISWVLNDRPMDQRTEVAWFLIKELLIGSATSMVSKAVESMGDDYIGSLDTSLQQWTLTMGVSGLPKMTDANVAKHAIDAKLLEISQNGFDELAMKGAMNKVEFMLRELNTKCGTPQGVHMFQKVLSKWTYDQDPRLALSYNDEFYKLREELEDPAIIEGKEFILELITKGLIDNTARSVATLYPSENMQIDAESKEIKWLDESNKYWDKDTTLKILGETDQLKRKQEAGDSALGLAALPRSSLDQLEKKAFEIPKTIHDNVFGGDVVMIENEVPESNGIAYVDFSIDISNVDFKDIIFIPLLCRLLYQAGTDRKTDVQMQNHIDQFTGGMTIEPLVEEVYEFQGDHGYKVDSGKHMVTKIVVRTSCFADKGCTELFNLLKSVLYDAKVNKKDKIINVLQDIADDLEDDIQTHGHLYTTRHIESRYSLPGYIREQWHGITQRYKASAALASAETDQGWNDLETRLLQMQDAIKRGHHNGLALSITGDAKAIKDLSGAVEVFFKDFLPPTPQHDPFPDFAEVEHPWVNMGNQYMNDEMQKEDPFTAFLVPTLVNDVGKGGLLYQVGEHITGADMAVTQYLGGFYLNEKIRFNLGATQAWAQLDADSGVMIYQSERTPKIKPVLEIFEDAAAWVKKQMEGTESLPVEAQAAIVGAVGQMDGSAVQPNQVGILSLKQYLKQDTPEGRQKWRDECLSTSKEDFLFFVDRLAGWGSASISAITHQKALDAAETEMKKVNMTTCSIDAYSCPKVVQTAEPLPTLPPTNA